MNLTFFYFNYTNNGNFYLISGMKSREVIVSSRLEIRRIVVIRRMAIVFLFPDLTKIISAIDRRVSINPAMYPLFIYYK